MKDIIEELRLNYHICIVITIAFFISVFISNLEYKSTAILLTTVSFATTTISRVGLLLGHMIYEYSKENQADNYLGNSSNSSTHIT